MTEKEKAGVAIWCRICGNSIPVPIFDFASTKFPICDECIKDLREVIIEKRKNAPIRMPYVLYEQPITNVANETTDSGGHSV